MTCLECGEPTFVIASRVNAENQTRRRRKCARGHRFTTYEVPGVTKTMKELYAQRLANRGFTVEAIENILED